MLRLHRAERPAALVDALARILAAPLADPFARPRAPGSGAAATGGRRGAHRSVIVYPTAGRKSKGTGVPRPARITHLMHRPFFVLFFWGGLAAAVAGAALSVAAWLR